MWQALDFVLYVVQHVVDHFHDVRVIEDVVDLVTLFVVAHQLVATQYTQLLGNDGLRHPECLHNVTDGDIILLVTEKVQDLNPGAIAQHLVNFGCFIN